MRGWRGTAASCTIKLVIAEGSRVKDPAAVGTVNELLVKEIGS